VPARDYGHDLPAMLRAVTPRTKAIFVANPNNPTGTLAAPEEIRQLLDQTPPQVVIVMDQAYLDYLEQPQDLLPLIRGGEKPNLILLRTFSKIYGLAGLRLVTAWAIAISLPPWKKSASLSTSIPWRKRRAWPPWTTKRMCKKPAKTTPRA